MAKIKIGAFIIPIRFHECDNYYKTYLDFAVNLEEAGFDEVYIGEHLTDTREDIRSNVVFSSALLSRTKRIKVGLAALPLVHYSIPHLIKILEDLYLLSQERLMIGISPGALKSDLEYLGIDSAKRMSLFNIKIEEFFNLKSNSRLLSKIDPKDIFTTVLAAYPAALKNAAGYEMSFISSNFTSRDWLSIHADCYKSGMTDNLSNLSISSFSDYWSIGWNLVPNYSDYTEASKKIIANSNKYISDKLSSAGKCEIVHGKRFIENDIHKNDNNLNKTDLIIQDIDTVISQTKRLKSSRSIIINIYDCLSDNTYRKAIFDLPSHFKSKF